MNLSDRFLLRACSVVPQVCLVAKGALAGEWTDDGTPGGERLAGVNWFRVAGSDGSGPGETFVPLEGVSGRSTYQPCADDLGCRLSAQAFDVRAPEVCRFVEIGPVAPDASLVASVEGAFAGGGLQLPVVELRVATIWRTDITTTTAAAAHSPAAAGDDVSVASVARTTASAAPAVASRGPGLGSGVGSDVGSGVGSGVGANLAKGSSGGGRKGAEADLWATLGAAGEKADGVATGAPQPHAATDTASAAASGAAVTATATTAPVVVVAMAAAVATTARSTREEVGPAHEVSLEVAAGGIAVAACQSDTPRGLTVAYRTARGTSGGSSAPADQRPAAAAAAYGAALLEGYDSDAAGESVAAPPQPQPPLPEEGSRLRVVLFPEQPCRVDVVLPRAVLAGSSGGGGGGSLPGSDDRPHSHTSHPQEQQLHERGLGWFGDQGGELWGYLDLARRAADDAVAHAAGHGARGHAGSSSRPQIPSQSPGAPPHASSSSTGSGGGSGGGGGAAAAAAVGVVDSVTVLESVTLRLTVADPAARDALAVVARAFCAGPVSSLGGQPGQPVLEWGVPWRVTEGGNGDGGSGGGNGGGGGVSQPKPEMDEAARLRVERDAARAQLGRSEDEGARLRALVASGAAALEAARSETALAGKLTKQATHDLKQELHRAEARAASLAAGAADLEARLAVAEAAARGAEEGRKQAAEQAAAEVAALVAASAAAEARAAASEESLSGREVREARLSGEVGHWKRMSESLRKECEAGRKHAALHAAASADLKAALAKNEALEELAEAARQEADAFKHALEHALTVTELPKPPPPRPPSKMVSLASSAAHGASTAVRIMTHPVGAAESALFEPAVPGAKPKPVQIDRD